ncbi:DUF4224 domain-containing protein [Burkholderia seminalis]|uniref:DUF4224 domain-containing protein n=1 Tax=Burkholderia seminalis TaxID=488731 RepID=UPI0014537711|nr:DUF4224 domain-containing protein [Burkholderia seminalis]MCA8430080.1 DUF4224 domain-containing protein [Burkholderia seminalis]VWB16824.1 hypothetical protein BSE24067_00611 [Burkholderia seminalis]
MSIYLTTPELAELVGCKPRSHACMKRWLERNHWPYAVNIAGVPLVAREYYDARMNGTAPQTAHARRTRGTAEQEPNFAAL